MRGIHVDDEIYAVLERNAQGFEQPNDVLRRLLLGPDHASPPGRSTSGGRARSVTGGLAALIAHGVVAAGDTLSHFQVRKNQRQTGVVEPDGWIKTDLGRYKSPSPALGDLVGTSINGWPNWIHDRSGKTLLQLRDEMGGAA